MNSTSQTNENPDRMRAKVTVPELNCCIRTGRTDLYELMQENEPPVREDLRHYGRCQRANLYFLTKGEPLSVHLKQRIRHTCTGKPVLLVDMHHARLIDMIDLNDFDGKPGSSIRIEPVHLVEFTKVTVCIIDFDGTELAHDHALPGPEWQQWDFVYIPKRPLKHHPDNLKVVIKASCRPREKVYAAVDPYEMPPEALREAILTGDQQSHYPSALLRSKHNYANKVVFRQRFGKTIFSKRPRRHSGMTENQVQHHDRFREAVDYAHVALTDPVRREEYRSMAPIGASPYNMAVADFLSPPKVHLIDASEYTGQPGDPITVVATDKCRVVSVRVKIARADGTLVEEGAAAQVTNGRMWIYAATEANPGLIGSVVTATATDVPEHTTELALTL
jgi:hypothetical protein